MVLQSPIRFRLLVLGLALSATIVAAQPTPVGPPPNSTDAKGKVDVSFLTLMVRNIAQMAVDSANAKLQKEGKSSRASIESLDVWGPYRSQGETLNKPNSWYVLVPYLLTIKVSIPITSDRHIGIPIDLNIFCDNWHTKSGTVTVRAQLGPASIEGGNILEDVIHVRDYIDANVRNAFNTPTPMTISLSPPCCTIGASNGGTAAVDDDAILWDVPPRSSPRHDDMVTPTLEVTFDRLKRLQARDQYGAILYREVEDILLNAYANYSLVQKRLSMREGDEVALGMPTIRLDARKFDNLVVIGSIEQSPLNPKDSNFDVASKTQNYAPGSHVLQIPKWYVMPPNQVHSKPLFVSVPAYELSYTVRFIDHGTLHP